MKLFQSLSLVHSYSLTCSFSSAVKVREYSSFSTMQNTPTCTHRQQWSWTQTSQSAWKTTLTFVLGGNSGLDQDLEEGLFAQDRVGTHLMPPRSRSGWSRISPKRIVGRVSEVMVRVLISAVEEEGGDAGGEGDCWKMEWKRKDRWPDSETWGFK